jgi:hypothetical protein
MTEAVNRLGTGQAKTCLCCLKSPRKDSEQSPSRGVCEGQESGRRRRARARSKGASADPMDGAPTWRQSYSFSAKECFCHCQLIFFVAADSVTARSARSAPGVLPVKKKSALMLWIGKTDYRIYPDNGHGRQTACQPGPVQQTNLLSLSMATSSYSTQPILGKK